MSDTYIRKGNFKEDLLERIKREGVEPRSRLYWLSQEYALWGAWGISVVLGALSIAMLSFTSVYVGYAFYEATHVHFITFLMEAVPLLWPVALSVTLLAAYYNLRHTSRGYKYPLLLVIGSSFGFSIVGGFALHFFGAGYYLDRYLGDNLRYYQSRAEFETMVWQRPEFGRLVGQATVVDETGVIPGVVFKDAERREWHVLTSALGERDRTLLMSGKKVRLLMASSSESIKDNLKDTVVACEVFPWNLDEIPVMAKFREDRERFVADLKERRLELRQVIGEVKEEVSGDERSPRPDFTGSSSAAIAFETPSGAPTPCSKLPLFTR